MSPDDIDSITLAVHSFLQYELNLPIDDNSDYDLLKNFMYDVLDKFVTRDRNYN